jgi:microcystin degradation protein MlrC
MRIAIAACLQETNSFSPFLTDLEAFRAGYLWFDKDLVHGLQETRTEVGAFLQARRQFGWEVVPIMGAWAISGGPVTTSAYAYLKEQLLRRLQDAGKVEGVLLALHGAMAVEGLDDATGDLLGAVRAIVGEEVPIVATLDLHANVTTRMVVAANALVGYHTFPHVDMYDTGLRAVRVLRRLLTTRKPPISALVRLPMLLPPQNASSAEGPFAQVMALVHEVEQTSGVLTASAYPVQPWLDVADVASSVLVAVEEDAALARIAAERVAAVFWRQRTAFLPDLTPVEEALRRTWETSGRPVILVDDADSPTSGSPGDSTALLQALLNSDVPDTVLLNIVDREAVASAAQAGVGAQVHLTVGGKLDAARHAPVTFEGEVIAVSDGRFQLKGPAFTGMWQNMGRSVVVRRGPIHLLIMERPVVQWDPELYRSAGLEPLTAKAVVVKSPMGYRSTYGAIAARIIHVDTFGASSAHLSRMPFRHVRRPIYPLDVETPFENQASLFA